MPRKAHVTQVRARVSRSAVERGRVDLLQPARELGDVRAAVAPFGRRTSLGGGEDALGEDPRLVAEVVDVVLARDAVAGRLEEPRDRVAEDGAARVADVQRPGRVRADELDVDALARRGGGAAVAATRDEDFLELGVERATGAGAG